MATAVGFGKPELKKLAQQLIAQCSDLFARRFGLEPREAQREAKRLVKQARKDLNGQALMQAPPRRGRRRLEQLRKSRQGLARWETLQRDGVREADFIRWWDHHVLEQEVIRRVDAYEQEHLLLQLTSRSRLSAMEAQHLIRMQCPMFGRPEANATMIGSHIPLPYELRPRVQAFLHQANALTLKEGSQRCMSLNAYLRERIKHHEL